GQSTTAYVMTNRSWRPSLLVLEGGDIYAYVVQPAGKGARTWKTPLTAAHSPNAYISGYLWAEALLQSTVIVPVPDPTKKIQVELAPESKELRPGDKTHVAVTTRDYRGRPTSAEVALSIVDEAIYAISPDVTVDPYGFYWGQQPSHVSLATSAPQ